MKTCVSLLLIISMAILDHAAAQSTAFTYQGRLTEAGAPYNGTAEFQFTLWDAASNGLQVAASSPASTVLGASNGLFSTVLDFGAAPLSGADRWLQIQVRTTLGPFITLVPRQRLTAAPYAIQSANAAVAATLSGPIPDSLLS